MYVYFVRVKFAENPQNHYKKSAKLVDKFVSGDKSTS